MLLEHGQRLEVRGVIINVQYDPASLRHRLSIDNIGRGIKVVKFKGRSTIRNMDFTQKTEPIPENKRYIMLIDEDCDHLFLEDVFEAPPTETVQEWANKNRVPKKKKPKPIKRFLAW